MKAGALFGLKTPLKKAVQICEKNKIPVLEWHTQHTDLKKILKEEIEYAKNSKIELQLHGPITYPLWANFSPEQARESIRLHKENIIFAHKIGATEITIHPAQFGHGNTLRYKYPFMNLLAKNLKPIYQLATKLKVTIALELFEGYHITEWIRWKKENNYPKIKFVYDVGHMDLDYKGPGPMLADITYILDQISSFQYDHVSNRKRTIGSIGYGGILEKEENFKKLLQLLKLLKWEGSLICEDYILERNLKTTKKVKKMISNVRRSKVRKVEVK